jgi:cysteine desulfurase family protein (TIGR01976 family)
MFARADGMNPSWNDDEVRAAFPAMHLRDDGHARLYADAPGGTQVAVRALERMREALVEHCANDGGLFRTSRAAEAAMLAAHATAATFVNAAAVEEVAFGLNTTSLLFHFSRMLARDWGPGDEILVTRMDHDANVAPWLIAAEERGAKIRWLEFDPTTYQYRYDSLDDLVGSRTRLVACNHASNLFGTINDVRRIVTAARRVGAVSVVDAVQSAPHIALDVQAIGCDILVSSPYKYFGPHAGLIYVRRELEQRLRPALKVRPSPDAMPYRHAPGTPSFEAQLGTVGAIEHLAWLGERFGGAAAGAPLRVRLQRGLAAATAHEQRLASAFLSGVAEMPAVRIFGPSDPRQLGGRVPTFSFAVGRLAPAAVAEAFAAENIFVWNGSFYAYEIAGVLGVRESGGVVRIGFAHYNTLEEVARIIAVLRALAARG